MIIPAASGCAGRCHIVPQLIAAAAIRKIFRHLTAGIPAPHVLRPSPARKHRLIITARRRKVKLFSADLLSTIPFSGNSMAKRRSPFHRGPILDSHIPRNIYFYYILSDKNCYTNSFLYHIVFLFKKPLSYLIFPKSQDFSLLTGHKSHQRERQTSKQTMQCPSQHRTAAPSQINPYCALRHRFPFRRNVHIASICDFIQTSDRQSRNVRDCHKESEREYQQDSAADTKIRVRALPVPSHG